MPLLSRAWAAEANGTKPDVKRLDLAAFSIYRRIHVVYSGLSPDDHDSFNFHLAARSWLDLSKIRIKVTSGPQKWSDGHVPLWVRSSHCGSTLSKEG